MTKFKVGDKVKMIDFTGLSSRQHLNRYAVVKEINGIYLLVQFIGTGYVDDFFSKRFVKINKDNKRVCKLRGS